MRWGGAVAAKNQTFSTPAGISRGSRTVEPFEDVLEIGRGDADARVGHGQQGFLPVRGKTDVDCTAVAIVMNGVGDKIRHAQVLQIANGELINRKLGDKNGRLAKLLGNQSAAVSDEALTEL